MTATNTDIERLFSESDGPDVQPIELLHRKHDGEVHFARKVGDDWQPQFNLPANQLPELFHFVVKRCAMDGYFSIHGMLASRRGRSKVEPDLPAPVRSGAMLRWLTAAFVDIDIYNLQGDWTVGKAVGKVIELQDAGLLPPASMIVRSGRGIWLLWILHDEIKTTKPVRAWPEKVEAWQRVQRELARLLANNLLPPDANARDVARVMRVPGSINGKVGLPVTYWVQHDASGEPFSYTLDGLATMLGVKPSRKMRAANTRVVDPVRSEAGRKGKRTLAAKRLRMIEDLATLRGGFQQGHRHHAAWLYATFLQQSCDTVNGVLVDDAGAIVDVRDRVEAFIRDRCDRGTDKVNANDVICTATDKHRKWSDEAIIERLQITDDEAKRIGFPTLTEARDKREAADKRTTRTDRAVHRQELVCWFILNFAKLHHGELPTLRDIEGWLSSEREVSVKPSTVMRDWDALAKAGRVPPRPRRWRKNRPAPIAPIETPSLPGILK